MRGEAVVEFSEPFQFSENGRFEQTSRVNLRAPGLGKRHVHMTMQAWVMDAFSGLQARRPALEAMSGGLVSQNKLDVDDVPVDEGSALGEDPMAFWQMMQMGLGADRFPRLADYIMKELTGSPKLGSVGENGSPITEAVWESLAETNGMAAIDKICGTFVGFFIEPRALQKPSGGEQSPSSSLRPKAASRSSTRTTSRSSS